MEMVAGQKKDYCRGVSDIAKAYILYRRQREKIRNMKSTMLDYKALVNSYVKATDWRVKENSTVTYSVGGLILSNSGAITANYWLTEIYDDEVARAHRNADIHIHDLSMLTGYCAGWSLKQLIQEGLGGIPGKITSAPASHLATLCNQMVNFLGIMQNEWAGAQAFSSFDTYLAPFVKKDNLDYEQVKKCIESFIYGVNTPSRWGTQAPFSNITLDWTVPRDLKDRKAIVGGKEVDFTYGDCQTEMNLINRLFIELILEGDADGRGFQYPIPTYNITRDFDWEGENVDLLFKLTAKYGTPYFQNFINSDLNPEDVRSMCCRLQLDKRELRKRGGGLFGSDEFTGSIGVFGMMPTFEKAISRLSLGTGGVATSPLADAMNPLKSVTPEYGKMMELSVARIYRDFISLVAKGRKMDEQKVAALAQGRVFTGRQAIDMGLADTLGGLDVALARAAEMANVPGAQAEFIERDGSGLSVMVMRLMRRAMVETGFAEAMRLATPAVQVLEPVQRLQQTVSGSMPLYAHCLCTPQ